MGGNKIQMMRYRIQFFDMANVVVLEITIEAENKQAAISKAKSILIAANWEAIKYK
jgi:hypothetical protein